MTKRIEVGLLGATGMVGQQFINQLAGHPWFSPTWLAASERSEGKRYADAAPWRLDTPIPAGIADRTVEAAVPGKGPKLVFSALDAGVAGELEQAFADAGHFVVTNSRNHRMEPDVPLLVPEINAEHLALAPRAAAAPRLGRRDRHQPELLHHRPHDGPRPAEHLRHQLVIVTTHAGDLRCRATPACRRMDIIGNVIPFIGGEEEKIEQETQKILGDVSRATISSRSPPRSARTATAWRWSTATPRPSRWSFDAKPSARPISRRRSTPSSGAPQERELPSAPAVPSSTWTQANRPQPRKDAERERGMAAFVGRLRPCPVLDYKFVVLSHNTIRGAAGAAVLNAELMHAKGCSTDAMIVMKFGGTSVESAAPSSASPRIVKGRRAASGRVVVSSPPWVRPPTSCWRSPTPRIEGKREEYIRAASRPARLPLARSAPGRPARQRAELDRDRRDHFQELTELVKGLAVLGELTPRSIDAISSYGERALQLHRDARLPALRDDGGARGFARRVIVTDKRHTQAAPNSARDLRAPRRRHSAARRQDAWS